MQADPPADRDEPAVPVTPTNTRPDRAKEQSPFTPAQRWLAERQVNVLCIAIAVLVPVLSLVYVNRAIQTVKNSTWVFNMDASGVMTYAPVQLADPKSRLYQEIVMQIAEAYLKRNPKGLSSPEAASRYFFGPSGKALQKELAQHASDRENRNLYDQPEFTDEPELLDASKQHLRYHIAGDIIRSGVLDNLPQRDVGHFKLAIELTPQPEFDVKGIYPFAVSQYHILITWQSDGRVEEFASLPGAKSAAPANP